MIILGYPSIGKSHFVKNQMGVIDLESSYWNDENNKKYPNWVENYCGLAEELSAQGHIVLIACHALVRKHFEEKIHSGEYGEYISPYSAEVYLCYPEITSYGIIEKRAHTRLTNSSEDEVGKNTRAYERIRDHFKEDISELENSPLPKIRLYNNTFLSDSVYAVSDRRYRRGLKYRAEWLPSYDPDVELPIFTCAAIMYNDGEGIQIMMGSRHHLIRGAIKERNQLEEYKNWHRDGFMIRHKDITFFADTNHATEIAKSFNIPMIGSVLTSEDLFEV